MIKNMMKNATDPPNVSAPTTLTPEALNDIRAGFERLSAGSPWAIPHYRPQEREFDYSVELGPGACLSIRALVSLKERNLIRFTGLKATVFRDNSTMMAYHKSIDLLTVEDVDGLPEFVNNALVELRKLCDHKNSKGVGGSMCLSHYKCLKCGAEYTIDSGD